MPPRRVALLIWSMSRGGAERQLAALVRHLDRDRYAPTVFVRRVGVEAELPLPEAPRSLDLARGWTPGGLTRLVRSLRALRPALLHTFMDPENLHGRIAARLAGVPRVVASVRCPALPWSTVVSERLSARLVDRWTVNSVGIRDALCLRAAIPREKVDVIENGVDSSVFTPSTEPHRRANRERFGAPDGALWVLPGRLSREKNQLAFLDALERAPSPGPRTVVLAGAPGLDGAYVRALRDRAASSRRDRVLLPGIVDEMPALLGAADAVFLPSEYEGISNAAIEAMSCASLVCVSRGANADRIVRDGVDGLELDAANADAIASGLRRVVALDAAHGDAMRAAARETAVRRFAVDAMARRTMDLYDACIGPR